jgi:hypothetical protein
MCAQKLAAAIGGLAVYGTVAVLSAAVAAGAPTETAGATLHMSPDVGNPIGYRITVKGVHP